MFLKECDIENFRSIKKLTLQTENKLHVLVGYNEAGKSNILKALSFLDPDVLPSDEDVRDQSYDEDPVELSKIKFVFSLEPEDTNTIFKNIKPMFLAKNINSPIIKHISKNYTLNDFCTLKNLGLYTVNILEKTKIFQYYSISPKYYSVFSEWKKIPTNWAHFDRFSSKRFKFISIKDFPEFASDSTLVEITPDDINDTIGAEIITFLKSNIFDCVIWNYSESNLLPAKIPTTTFQSNPKSCEPLQNMFWLAGYNDITKSLQTATLKKNGIKNLLRKVSENTTSHLSKVWPEYKSLSIELSVNGDYIEAGINDEFNFYSLDRRSDGFKRFITFLLMISAKVKADYLKDTLIIIDEPDIGLHPSGVGYLREELKKISKNNIVFIATHSIFMIDKERIDTQLIVKKAKEETSVISDYSSDMLDEEVIYKAMGYSFYDLLKKTNLVFEGWSDKKVFQIWINSNKTSAADKKKWKQIGLLHAFGSKDVNRVTGQLEDFNRNYLILSDSDKPSLDWQKKFSGTGTWLTYKDLGFEDKETIEDFLSEDHIDKCIIKVLKKEQLDKGITLPNGVSFNAKVEHIKKDFPKDKDEFDRIKRQIKDEVFESLKSEQINLKELFSKVNEKI